CLDANGNAWDEPGYEAPAVATATEHASAARSSRVAMASAHGGGHDYYEHGDLENGDGGVATAVEDLGEDAQGEHRNDPQAQHSTQHERDVQFEAEMAMERIEGEPPAEGHPS